MGNVTLSLSCSHIQSMFFPPIFPIKMYPHVLYWVIFILLGVLEVVLKEAMMTDSAAVSRFHPERAADSAVVNLKVLHER